MSRPDSLIASPSAGTLHRIARRLRRLFGRRAQALPGAPVSAGAPSRPASAADLPVALPLAPSTARTNTSGSRASAPWAPQAQPEAVLPPALPPPAQVAPALPPVPARTMRSLAEVRADLARLRESARERHARVPVPAPRDPAFEPTDFMDFHAPAAAPAEKPFAQTAFLDFTILKSRGGT